jgi:alpha-glucuronidase
MKLMVPTLMCKAMLAQDTTVAGKELKAGAIIDMPYGHAITLKAIGGVKAIVDEDAMHVKAQEELATYGADAWFPHPQQTMSRVADFLAHVGAQASH